MLGRSLYRRAIGFSPLDLSPAAWFKFNTGITEAAGAVSQWDDQSGNGRHLKQATGGAQPALQVDGTILFDGSSDYLKCDSFTLAQPVMIAAVLKMVSWTSADYWHDGNALNTLVIQEFQASPKVRMYVSGGSVSSDFTLMALGTYGAVYELFSGASSYISYDDNAANTATLGTTSPSGFTLGCGGDGTTGHSNIQVAEVCIFPAAITGANLTSLKSYLADIRDAL